MKIINKCEQNDYFIQIGGKNMDQGTFIEKVKSEYNFAKEHNFDSINIVIETTGGDYEISEYENGFVNDNLDGVYSDIEDIAGDMYSIIRMSQDKVEGFRIE